MKKQATILLTFTICVHVALSSSPSVDDLLLQYAGLCGILASRIDSTISTNGFTDVSVVYAAGFLHSPSNATALLANIELQGLDEPDRWYGYSWNWGEGNDNSFPTGILETVSNELSWSSTIPLLCRPPTPAVGALSQMPVSWTDICLALEHSPPDSRRTALLAWVAACRHPDMFWNWMRNAEANAPEIWGRLSLFANSNLHARKPFSMQRYEMHLRSFQPDIVIPYLHIVSVLREKARVAEADGAEEEYARVVSALNQMGQSVNPDDDGNVERISDSSWPTNVNVVIEQTPLPWND